MISLYGTQAVVMREARAPLEVLHCNVMQQTHEASSLSDYNVLRLLFAHFGG